MLTKTLLLTLLSKSVVYILAFNSINNPDQTQVLIISKSLNEILQSCFQDHLNPLIVTEQSSKYIFHEPKTAVSLSLSSIIIINDKFKIHDHARNCNPHIGTFIMITLTDDQLTRNISQLQSTPWWNTESYFFLIGLSCAEASKMLAIMWKNKILSVIYLCLNNETVMLYTFNPFNNYAPHPWQWSGENQDRLDPGWILYKHQYQKDRTLCPAIMFDKTVKLDNYVVSVIMDKKARQNNVPTGVPIRMSDYTQYIYSKRISVTMNDVFSYMNVKINITDSDHLKCCLQTNNEKLLQKVEDLLDNALVLRPQPMYLGYKHVTYPDARVLMVLLGQKRPFLSTEEKIFSFFHPSISTPIIIVFVICTIILRINQPQENTLALLKVWKLFLGSSINQPLNDTPTRMFFIGVFWLVLIFNGVFQSKLASFLTKPERIYVNSIEDAFELKYDIYGPVDYMTGTGYLELPAEQQKYLHLVETDRCVDSVLNNSQALCLTNPNYGTTNAKKYKLHLSSPVLIFYTSYWVSPEFPLKNKIDTTILRLQVTGLTGRVLNQVFFERLGFLRAHENEETRFNHRPIELTDLLFIFKFIILGHVCSLVVFIVEFKHR